MSTYTPNRRQFLSTAVLGSIAVGVIASEAAMPPLTDFCYIAAIFFGSDKK